jgi:hypothetical protein
LRSLWHSANSKRSRTILISIVDAEGRSMDALLYSVVIFIPKNVQSSEFTVHNVLTDIVYTLFRNTSERFGGRMVSGKELLKTHMSNSSMIRRYIKNNYKILRYLVHDKKIFKKIFFTDSCKNKTLYCMILTVRIIFKNKIKIYFY